MSSNPNPVPNQLVNSNAASPIVRYRQSYLQIHGDYDNATSEYMNVLCMILSMLGLMMKIKLAAFMALFCSSINFANSRIGDESKQIVSSFMLSISAIIVNYLQDPMPLTLFSQTS